MVITKHTYYCDNLHSTDLYLFPFSFRLYTYAFAFLNIPCMFLNTIQTYEIKSDKQARGFSRKLIRIQVYGNLYPLEAKTSQRHAYKSCVP